MLHIMLYLSLLLQTSLILPILADQKPLYQNDPCRAVMLDGRSPDYLNTEIHYKAKQCQQLSRGIVLAWELHEHRIDIEVHAATDGWVSVGFNRRASMLGGDVAVGWVNDHGKAFLYDCMNDAELKQAPSIDEQQDVELLQAREKNSVTSLRISRPLLVNTTQDLPIGGRVWIIWAFGTEDPEDDKIEYLGFHVREGATSIRFFDEPSITENQDNEEL